jgi:hypothetical protein
MRSALVGLTLFVVAGIALAQGSPLSPRQAEILREVANVEGGLTRAQYDEFWAGFRNLGAAEREGFRRAFRSELPAILTYQRTLWLAARESVKQRKPIVTPELRKEFEQLDRSDRKRTRPQGRAMEMKRSAHALLEGAAYQTPVTKEGRTFQVTPEVIEQVLRGLNGSISRLERLLSETWQSGGTQEN